jgi:ABC-2 type transport system permease protein
VTIPLLSQIHLVLQVQNILLSLIAVIFSISIIFTMSMLLGLLAFWFTHVNVIDSIFWAVRMILAGQVVPLSFIPENLQAIIILLPFRYMVSFPLDIFLGKLSSQDIFVGYLIALIWTVILAILYIITWDRGVKAYTSFGS